MKFKGRIRKKSALKEGQKENLDQRVYLESIMSSMTDSLIVVNPDATLRSVNKAALDLLGYKEEELIGQAVKKIFLQGEKPVESSKNPEEEEILHKYFKKIIDAGAAHNISLTFLTKQGQGIPINFSGAVMEQDGKIVGIVGVARDMRQTTAIINDLAEKKMELEERGKSLTRMQRGMLHMMGDLDIAKKEAEKANVELRELGQMKSDFISTVSHELRTPLATMKEFTSIVSDEIPGKLTKEQKEYIDIIKGNIDRLVRLINNLLDISKIESGNIELEKRLVDIKSLAKTTVSTLKPEADRKYIEVKTLFPAVATDVYADPDKITQVFTNLISNAIKFTPEKGKITVEIKDAQKEIECSVTDTGKGIGADDMDKLFTKFRQLDRVAGAGAKGTGLGLAISKELVESHNGRIWAESKIGEGSKFTFTLPKHSKEEILRETIEEKIAKAKKEYNYFSIFIIRLDDYAELEEGLGKDKAQEAFLPVSAALGKVMRHGDFIVTDKNEIVAFIEAKKEDMPQVIARLKKAIKMSIFEIEEQLKLGFSYGCANYPNDADDAEYLLERANKSFIREREARLMKTIMIVDDEPAVRDVLKRNLQASGYSNFSEAGDGKEVLEKIKTAIPDLLLLDLKMPLMSGYEVIGVLKENMETKDIPVLLMSGYPVEIDEIKEYLRKKAIPVAGKPFDLEQIKRLIDYLL